MLTELCHHILFYSVVGSFWSNYCWLGLFIYIWTGIILQYSFLKRLSELKLYKLCLYSHNQTQQGGETVDQCSALEGTVSVLISDSFRAAYSTVWCMLVLLQPLMTVCCNVFRVWLPGKDLDSASHYSITIKHKDTRIHTLHVFVP